MVLKHLPNGKQFVFEKSPPHQPLVAARSSATARAKTWPTVKQKNDKKMMEDRRSSVRSNEDFTRVAVANTAWNGVRERKVGFINE